MFNHNLFYLSLIIKKKTFFKNFFQKVSTLYNKYYIKIVDNIEFYILNNIFTVSEMDRF